MENFYQFLYENFLTFFIFVSFAISYFFLFKTRTGLSTLKGIRQSIFGERMSSQYGWVQSAGGQRRYEKTSELIISLLITSGVGFSLFGQFVFLQCERNYNIFFANLGDTFIGVGVALIIFGLMGIFAKKF